ncbi:MAG: 23S rRNA (guanosine(2251)-2'-O)-methyltransferase RlmB [Deltaproteobacteria bacterium]|nr:23S rRNA (guanosine(2251)-2'-O)-methyltransferase RlmB [Deltaproteobacteria bacterium]
MWITGKHPVEELLGSIRQKATRLLLSDSMPAETVRHLSERAGRLRIPCATCQREEWERRTGDRGGGGIAAELAEFHYADFHDWAAGLGQNALVFLLDGITDPQNLGSILRNARAFGVDGVVVPKDRSSPVTAAVFRSSAGAAAHVPLILVTNLARTVEGLQEKGFWMYAAAEKGETGLFDLKPAARTGIVLGSEEHGIRKLVREKCDGSVRIQMEPGIDSLNVGVASGILAFFLRGMSEKR